MSENNTESCTKQELEDMLLYSSRHGDVTMVTELLTAKAKGKADFDLSCKGKSKSNLGWTPLHLATYFGHQHVVELLLLSGCNVNAVNEAGDSALHKAAFIGREDIVLLLLQYNASVCIKNGENKKPCQVSKPGSDIYKLLLAAHTADTKRKEERFLTAARENDLVTINLLLKDPDPPSINCVDVHGNSALHCAAYRGHKEVAVLLLQNGIDSTLKNKRGQTAVDLAKDLQMEQVLNVKPIKALIKTAERFEGQLLKRSRFLGWKPVWAVLERGVLTYFNSRGDGSLGLKRKDFKYLDGAKVIPLEHNCSTFVVHFNDTAVHRLSVVDCGESKDTLSSGKVERQKWINAFQEHIAYNNYYVGHGQVLYDSDEEDPSNIRPLGSMKDSLQTATVHKQLLDKQLKDVEMVLKALGVKDEGDVVKVALNKFLELNETSNEMLSSLNHCLTLFQQQEELRILQLKQEQEKCRVLEEALNVLAKEHHELEQSLASGSDRKTRASPRFYDTSDDEFYDAFDADSDSDTLVSLATPMHNDDDDDDDSPVLSIMSRGSSCSTLIGDLSFMSARDTPTLVQNSCWDKISRTQLPVPMFSRNDFSIWSVLKNCIGKELSKITMPVIFNEPLSFLQRLVEYMEYAYLLRRASEQQEAIDRMKYVAAFAVSALASNWERLGKPFNPLLGETYELQRPEFRIICEQVSHHPPVSAFHADSKDFIFHGSIHPKLKFWGKSVEIQPKGTVTVELPKWGEAYTWQNVNCCVHNIIVGKLWIEQYGTMEVINHTTGHRAILTFKPAGWFSKDLHRVEGYILDPQKKKSHFLYGKWTEFIRCTDIHSFDEYYKENAHKFKRGEEKKGGESPAHTPRKVLAKLNSLKMGVSFKQNSVAEEDGPPDIGDGDIPKSESSYSIDIPNSVTLWDSNPRPSNSVEYYQFSNFAMSLNELDDQLRKELCPTDSRLRPDIRKLEEGDIDGAATEKNRLEEKQRDARKSRKGKKGEWAPRWFTQGSNPHTKVDDWLYSGGFWDREFSEIEEIF